MFGLEVGQDSRGSGARVGAALEHGISQGDGDYCRDSEDEEGEELPL